MSMTARRLSPSHRHQCECGRQALYFSSSRRRMRFMPDHPLCRRCYRSLLDSVRSRSRPRSVSSQLRLAA